MPYFFHILYHFQLLAFLFFSLIVFLFLKFSQVEVFKKELWLYEVLFSSDLLILANTQCSSRVQIKSNICLESFLTGKLSSVIMTYSLPSYKRKVRIHYYYFILFCLIKTYIFRFCFSFE